MNPGKGGQLVSEWADKNEPVDIYGYGPFLPAGPNINLRGPVDQRQVPTVLSGYERFVFLPTSLEPFGRCVVEAHAAGLEIVTNQLVGACEWVYKPDKIESAARDFWSVVCHR
jgi:glycosyltransferase involved in cell wall biosynthesis